MKSSVKHEVNLLLENVSNRVRQKIKSKLASGAVAPESFPTEALMVKVLLASSLEDIVNEEIQSLSNFKEELKNLRHF